MMVQNKRRHWIPPAGLGSAFAAHGASWVLLLFIGLSVPMSRGFMELGWLHLVALGWLTMAALSILIHVIPGFTDATWKGQGIARLSLVPYGIGVVCLVTAFCSGSTAALPWAGTLIVLALLGYLIPAGLTLASVAGNEPREVAIARALGVTLTALLITALLGATLAWALDGKAPSAILATIPPVHGSFGIFAWLTVLIMGVSTRTVRPITGARSRFSWIHITAGSAVLLGVIILLTGLLVQMQTVTWAGFIVLAFGTLIYVADMCDILRRSTKTHRPPQAFLGASCVWFLTGVILVGGLLSGAPWGTATIYVLLIGWIGQMVNGHIYHIGIRLLATVVHGDDDETEPALLLTTPLSWISFVLFQLAAASGVIALITANNALLLTAAICGLVGWATMLVNILIARQKAYQLNGGLIKLQSIA